MAPSQTGPKPYRAIGERLEVLRVKEGFRTKAAFAKSLGISTPSYNLFSTGSRQLSLDVAILLHERYRTSLDWLYLGLSPATRFVRKQT